MKLKLFYYSTKRKKIHLISLHCRVHKNRTVHITLENESVTEQINIERSGRCEVQQETILGPILFTVAINHNK